MKIRSLIFDMDGVLWKDRSPIMPLEPLFDRLNQVGIRYTFATNNSTQTPQQYQKKLKSFGVDILPEQVITSGTTLASMMAGQFPSGGPVFIIGEEGLFNILKQFGFYYQEENVIAVAAGMDRTLTYEKLKKASLNIQAGASFYFSNIDPTFPSPEGKIPGAGSILAALETACGEKAIIPGKPQPYMFENALKWLNTRPEETLVIGDRLDTDILGGINAKCKTALVLSGVTSKEELQNNAIQPDFTFDHIGTLIDYFIENDWDI